MLIDEIKKANIQAMKDKDADARSVYSVVINKYNNLAIELKAEGKEPNDTNMISVIQKTVKELEEELVGWVKLGRQEKIDSIQYQKNLINNYLPKQLSKDEIKTIIDSLEDKSIPSVMKHFKTNYAGQVDMRLVNEIVKGS